MLRSNFFVLSSLYEGLPNVLIEALPYIQRLADTKIVIKFGGNAMIDEKLKNKIEYRIKKYGKNLKNLIT